MGVQVLKQEVLRVRLRRIAHLGVELDARGQSEQLVAGRAIDPARGALGLGRGGEGQKIPLRLHVLVKSGACVVICQCLPHHAFLDHDVSGLVRHGGAVVVGHVEHDVDAFLATLFVRHEVGPHGQGVALHHQQVRGVAQLLIQGGDVADAVLGDDVFLGRGQDCAKQGQSKAHVGQGRPHLIQFAFPHLDDVIGVAEGGEQRGEEQRHPWDFVRGKVVGHHQGACQHARRKQRTNQLAQHGLDVRMLVLEPLGQANEQENEDSQRHLNHVVGPVQVGAWGQVVLGQIAQERQSCRTFRPRQQRGERLQEQIEDGDAGLPSDVHGPKDQQQGADEHPKFP